MNKKSFQFYKSDSHINEHINLIQKLGKKNCILKKKQKIFTGKTFRKSKYKCNLSG